MKYVSKNGVEIKRGMLVEFVFQGNKQKAKVKTLKKNGYITTNVGFGKSDPTWISPEDVMVIK